MTLAELYLSQLSRSVQDSVNVPALSSKLTTLLERAQSQLPGVLLPTERFLCCLAARAGASLPDDATELYLACACAEGDPVALKTLTARYFPPVQRALSRMGLSSALIEDIQQQLQQRLLVSTPEQPAKLVDYAGRGDLSALLRTAAVRLALNQLRNQAHLEEAPAPELDEVLEPKDDPELALIKQRHRADFKAAFQQAVSDLSSRERNLLRLSAVEQLSIDQLGALFGVHRATAARWVAQARAALATKTRARLSQVLGLSLADVDSLVRLIDSQLDVSLTRVLQPSGNDLKRA